MPTGVPGSEQADTLSNGRVRAPRGPDRFFFGGAAEAAGSLLAQNHCDVVAQERSSLDVAIQLSESWR